MISSTRLSITFLLVVVSLALSQAGGNQVDAVTGGTGTPAGQASPNGLLSISIGGGTIITAITGLLTTLVNTIAEVTTGVPTTPPTSTTSTTGVPTTTTTSVVSSTTSTTGVPTTTTTSSTTGTPSLTVSYYGTFWKDLSNNGLRDPTDPDLVNINVTVTGGPDVLTFTTGPDGELSIPSSLLKNTEYCFTLALPDADKATRTRVTPISGSYIADPNVWNRFCFQVTDQPIVTDTYSLKEHQVNGLTWVDRNNNGIQDSNEPYGASELFFMKVTFTLQGTEFIGYTKNGIIYGNGNYFKGLIPGDYCVQFDSTATTHTKVPPSATYAAAAVTPSYCFYMPESNDFSGTIDTYFSF
eukprot:gene13880-16371_t